MRQALADPHAAELNDAEANGNQPLRILYLAAESPTATLVQQWLQATGYTVDRAQTSAVADLLLNTHHHPLLLLQDDHPVEELQAIAKTLTTGSQTATLYFVTTAHAASRMVEALSDDFLFQGDPATDLHLLQPIIERTLRKHAERQTQALLLDELRQDNRNLTLLTRLAQLLTSTLEMEQVIAQLVQTITEIVVTEGSSVWLWDNEAPGYLVCAAMYLDGQDITSNKLRMAPGQGVVGWVAQYGQPVNVVNVAGDLRFSSTVDSQTGYTTKSILAVPLSTRNQVIGVLEFVNKLEGYFNERDQQMAETVAVYAANALENARLLASIRRQRDLLERQNEALDAFAHSVAHDLKNPLTLVVGFADMLSESYEELPPETIRESLNTIVEYGIKMNSIVDALLMLANVGAEGDVDLEPVNMQEIIRAVLRRIEHMIKEYNGEVLLPERWPVVLGDSSWLEEVWYNYLSNGLKYGGRPPRLQLGYDQLEGDEVRFWVQDNGAGMTIENPMSLFTQQRRRRERSTQGHGLGLSIVYRIIDRLGGRVGVETTPGAGSRFSFTLRVA
jgi:K+-sensing histidine kinase KdpD